MGILNAILGALLLAAPASAQNSKEVGFTVEQWGGLSSQTDSGRISDFDSPDAANVLTDRGFLEPRPGIIIATAVPSGVINSLGHYGQSNSVRYVVMHSSNNIYRSDLGTALVKVATVSNTTTVDFTPAFGNLYITDGAVGLLQITATSSGIVAAAPTCYFGEFAQERFWCANIPTESGSRLRVSSFGGVGYWTVPANVSLIADAPNSFDFQKDDGENIQCMKNTPWGMVVGKASSMHVIKGLANDTFRKQLISPTVGCSDDRTMQMHEGLLTWLSKDGVYTWPGAGPPEIVSRDIDRIVKNIRQGQQDSWTVDSQDDFAAGVLDASGAGALMSATKLPGSVIPSSSTLSDDTTAELLAGFVVRLTTTNVNDPLISLASNTSSGFNVFENFNDGSLPPWSCYLPTPTSLNACGITSQAPLEGTFASSVTVNCTGGGVLDSNSGLYVFDVTGATRTTISVGSLNCEGGGSTHTINTSSYYGTISRLHFVYQKSTDISELYSATFTARNTVTIQCTSASGSTGGECAGTKGGLISVDNIQLVDIGAFFSSGTLFSAVLDTGFSTPTAGAFTVSSNTPPGTALAFQVRQSPGLTGPFSAWSTLNNGDTLTLNQRYWQYLSSFTTTLSTVTPSIRRVALQASSTGYYASVVRFIGTDITSWGQFSGSSIGTTPSYQIRSSVSIFGATDLLPAWVSQPNLSSVTVPTGAYAQWRALLGADTAIGRVAVNWNEGVTVPAASASFGQRYFLCAAFYNSSTANDSCLIWQRNKKWIPFTGPRISALDVFDRELYGGQADGVKVYKMMKDNVYSDDSMPINSWWTTKDFMFGPNGRDWPVGEKTFTEIWLEAAPSSGTIMGVAYAINKSTNYATTSLDLGAYGDTVNRRLPFSTLPHVGKYMRGRFSNAQQDKFYQINAYSVFGEPNPKTLD